jgi:hypothetical protein
MVTLTAMPAPTSSADAADDRQRAETTYLRLSAERQLQADPAQVQAWSDDGLISALRAVRQVPIPLPPAADATLAACMPRALALGMDRWCADNGITDPDHRDCKDFLADVLSMDVHTDGLLAADRWGADQRAVAGERPIALFHHTSSRLRARIRREGLRVVDSRPGQFNSKAGVYLTTQTGGPAPDHYADAACHRARGGDSMTIRVRTTLDALRDDPDDQDLIWTHGRQFVMPSVPPAQLAWSWTTA